MPLLAPSTNAAYRGPAVAAWFLAFAALLEIGPGLIHSFLPDGGAGVIAHLEMGPQRQLVIDVFRWEGAVQLAFGLAMLSVAVRYRPLTPLFLALLVLERGLMALHGWVLSPPASGRHPPEHYGSVVAVALGLAFLAISVRARKA